MFPGRVFLGLVLAMTGLVAGVPRVSAQTAATIPQAPMTVPLYAYGPVIEAPSPRRYRQPYWSRYASPYGQGRGLRARPYRYRGTYGGWSIARPYYYGSRAMPFYRYRWTEGRPYVGTPRFAARILTPQARPGLLHEARRY